MNDPKSCFRCFLQVSRSEQLAVVVSGELKVERGKTVPKLFQNWTEMRKWIGTVWDHREVES